MSARLTTSISAATSLPCQENDAEWWFAEQPKLLSQAQSLCAVCPLREACLSGALQRREPWGVWGGEIFFEGRIVAIKRGRGRPPKDAAAA